MTTSYPWPFLVVNEVEMGMFKQVIEWEPLLGDDIRVTNGGPLLIPAGTIIYLSKPLPQS